MDDSCIAYLDLEINETGKKIEDIGVLYGAHCFHGKNIATAIKMVQSSKFICGHNFLHHDYHFVEKEFNQIHKSKQDIIDTLLLSVLLFPTQSHHALNKTYKSQFNDQNNPLQDCKITQELLIDLCLAFVKLPVNVQSIFYTLLKNEQGFSAFFRYLGFEKKCDDLPALIHQTFIQDVCKNADIAIFIKAYPVALSYALALIFCQSRSSILHSWAIRQYPQIDHILKTLCATPCKQMCDYCLEHLDIQKALKKYFNYDKFRTYDDKPLQAQAAGAAVLG